MSEYQVLCGLYGFIIIILCPGLVISMVIGDLVNRDGGGGE